MWRKILRVVSFLLAVALIAAYICYASHLADRHLAEQRVEEVAISVANSTATEQFASPEYIGKQLQNSGFVLANCRVDSVDAVKLERFVAKNGFVRSADVYVTYSGILYIDVEQHNPVMRLLCGGVNSYITAEGDIFSSPRGGTCYTSVVTGSYRPPFKVEYEGSMADCRAKLIGEQDAKLNGIYAEIARLKQSRSECQNSKIRLRKSCRRGVLESKDKYHQRKLGVEMEIEACNGRLQQIDKQKATLEHHCLSIVERKKKIVKYCDDFTNLITFVGKIKADPFWNAEVVQFIADTTSMGEISLRLIPRSGNFVVEFGTLAEQDEKLAKLQKFYDRGLSRFGWDRFRVVDLRYKKQVICTE